VVLIYARFADNRYNELTRENGVTVGVIAAYAASIALANATSGAASYYAKLLPDLAGSGGDDVLTATWTDPCTAGVVINGTGGRGLHAFTLELNLTNSRTHS